MNARHPPKVPATATAPADARPALRREQLRQQLLATVDSLHRRRADLVPEGFIADYVALGWLEWNGGALRTTLTGTNVCNQLRAGLK